MSWIHAGLKHGLTRLPPALGSTPRICHYRQIAIASPTLSRTTFISFHQLCAPNADSPSSLPDACKNQTPYPQNPVAHPSDARPLFRVNPTPNRFSPCHLVTPHLVTPP